MSALSALFGERMEQYAARYDVSPASYEDVKRGYQEKYANDWKKELVRDVATQTGGNLASVRRQINRYDDGTRGKSGKGEKYGQAFRELGKDLPKVRKIPQGRAWKVKANIYFQISGSKVKRTASATFRNPDGSLEALLDQYKQGGTLTDADLDIDTLEGLGAIEVQEL